MTADLAETYLAAVQAESRARDAAAWADDLVTLTGSLHGHALAAWLLAVRLRSLVPAREVPDALAAEVAAALVAGLAVPGVEV